jgi:hypothetical protein
MKDIYISQIKTTYQGLTQMKAIHFANLRKIIWYLFAWLIKTNLLHSRPSYLYSFPKKMTESVCHIQRTVHVTKSILNWATGLHAKCYLKFFKYSQQQVTFITIPGNVLYIQDFSPYASIVNPLTLFAPVSELPQWLLPVYFSFTSLISLPPK